MKIKIGNKWVGENSPLFIVAEGGINHNGSLKIAKKIVERAAISGADAVKFQTFKAEDMASPASKFFKIFKKIELSSNDFKELADYAKSQKIIFLSTPFSEKSVDLLCKIKVPAFKIASGDITHIPLLAYAAKKKKPMIISTGMSYLSEIKFAVKKILSTGNKKIILLHSNSAYPTPPKEVNLNAIFTLKKNFEFPIGFSDNGSGLQIPLTAVAIGINVLEKHFTINKKLKGPDQKFSSDPKEFRNLVVQARALEKILGDGKKIPQKSEANNRILARRSIIAQQKIFKGEKIQKRMIKIQRPAKGIPPKDFSKVLGRKVRKDINKFQPITWKHLI